MAKTFRTKIIIPCYNEATSFQLEEYLMQLKTEEYLDLCFVNDGSTDDTLSCLQKLKDTFPNRIEIIDYKENKGKAEAIRTGMLSSNFEGYEYTGYLDADLAFPLDQVRKFYAQFYDNARPKFVLGARVRLHGSTNVSRPFFRHIFSRVFATVVSNMLRMEIYDTQTGAKLIEPVVAKKMFETQFISRWLFDIELIYRFRGLFSKEELRIHLWELPISICNDVGSSSIKKSYLLKIPFELFKIWKTYRKT